MCISVHIYIYIQLYIYNYIYTIIYTHIYKDTKYIKQQCVWNASDSFFQSLIPGESPRLDLGSEHHRSGTTSKQTFTWQTHPEAGQFSQRPFGWSDSLSEMVETWADFLKTVKGWIFWWCDFVTLGGKKRFNQWIEKKSQNSVSLRSSGSWIKSSRFGRLLGKMLKKMICRTFLLIVVIKKYTPWN